MLPVDVVGSEEIVDGWPGEIPTEIFLFLGFLGNLGGCSERVNKGIGERENLDGWKEGRNKEEDGVAAPACIVHFSISILRLTG